MTNQTPYGGGGFPPPWLGASTPATEQEPTWGEVPTSTQGLDSSAPSATEWVADGAGEVPVRIPGSEPSFDSILGTFTQAPDQQKPKRKQKPAKVKRDRGGAGKGKKVAAVIVLASIVGGGGFLAYNTFFKGNGNESAVAQEVDQVSRDVPPGWSKATAWTTPGDVASSLAVRNDYIAYLNSAGVLVVLDGKKGESVFSSTPTGANPEESRVIISQIGDVPIVTVVQNTSISSWRLDKDSPAATSNDIPASASVSSGGGGVMVNANGETWRMNSDLGLEKVQGLPSGNTSLGMTLDGDIITGSPEGGWGINDGKNTKPVKVALADGAVGSVMYPTRAAKGFVVAWAPTNDKQKRAVGLYKADGSLISSTLMPTAQVNLGLPLVVTDGGKLASAGTWLVDLERGETETVDGWVTNVGIGSEIYGKTKEGKFVWRGSGKPASVPESAATPWGVTSEGLAIIIAPADDGSKVIAALHKE